MKHKLVIWGASGHALVVADIIKLNNKFDIVGFVDDFNPVTQGQCFSGLPVFGKDYLLKLKRRGEISHVIVAIGNCQARLQLAEWSINQGITLASAIHPSASVAYDSSLGDGAVISAGAVVNSGAVLGDNVIVNTCSSVDHECILGDGVHICPGAHLAGRVHVGRGAWIGIGSSVVDRVRIGAGTVIGAGSVVVHDIPDGMLAYGVPAKVIKGIV